MENKFLKLTDTVYKVLEFFPESDPLKNRAKDRALAIMEHFTLINENSGWASFQKEKIKAHLLEDIDVLLGYLWIGKAQGWLNSVNCLIIANEYEKLKKDIEPAIELTRKLPGIEDPAVLKQGTQTSPQPVLDETGTKEEAVLESFNIPERQAKILEFLAKNDKTQVMDLQKILPDVTKRTIRRDLDELLLSDKILRSGEFNEVFYQIKR